MIKSALLGTLAYTAVTFPLAVLWHVVLFGDIYRELGYFEGEPSFILGLLTIIIQGAVLSFLFPYVAFSGGYVARGLKYALLIGVFFWTSHVLAFIAKQTTGNPALFLAMESVYLLCQFAVYGVLIGIIHKRRPRL